MSFQKKNLLPGIAILTLLGGQTHWAVADAGSDLSGVCAGCHGSNGIGVTDAFPNLAGQKAAYIATQLHHFKDGTRQAPLMNQVASGIKEEDIAILAEYYARLKP